MLLVWVVKEKICAKKTQRLLTLAEVQTQTNKNSDKAKKKKRSILESVCSRILPENSFNLKLFSIS